MYETAHRRQSCRFYAVAMELISVLLSSLVCINISGKRFSLFTNFAVSECMFKSHSRQTSTYCTHLSLASTLVLMLIYQLPLAGLASSVAFPFSTSSSKLSSLSFRKRNFYPLSPYCTLSSAVTSANIALVGTALIAFWALTALP